MDKPITVTELNRYVKSMFSLDPNLRSVTVKGEVSNFKNHEKTGHFYFTLKDSQSSIRAVMFRGNAQKVKFSVENGMNVVITGSVAVFERDGVYQIYCEMLEPDGVGALYLAFEQLKEKLFRQGLFDKEHKKLLPRLPQKIGVVTSPTGAALQDILNILKRRYPIGTVVVFPALVQGENAAPSIVSGIEQAAHRGDIDVLIVGRGGGSIEDLWAFNEETVARAVYNCPIPVISAVGHEIDYTICDFAADLRAPTPSAAAELCAPDISSLSSEISMFFSTLEVGMTASFKRGYDQLKEVYAKLLANSPAAKLARYAEETEAKASRRELAMKRILETRNDRLRKEAASLEALSPLRVLTRGYSITYSGEKIVSSVEKLNETDRLTTVFPDGRVESVVVKIEKKTGALA